MTSMRHNPIHSVIATVRVGCFASPRGLRVLISAFLWLGIAYTPLNLHSGNGVWTPSGPEGGWVTTVQVDPTNSSIVYAATLGNGVYKSTNGGGSWSSANAGRTDSTTWPLVIDPQVPSTLYAGAIYGGGGVTKSVDGGATWTATGLIGANIGSICVNPVSPQTLWALTDNTGVAMDTRDRLYRSTNGGTTWEELFDLPIGGGTLAVDPSNPSTLYLARDPEGMFRSTDGGVNWYLINSGLDNLHCSNLLLDPAVPGTLYVYTWWGEYRSFDGGNSWAYFSDYLVHAIEPGSSNTIYGAIDGQTLSKSTDGGATWTDVHTFGKWIQVVQIDPLNTATLYASRTGGGVLKSTDAGATWVALNSGLQGAFLREISSDSGSNGTLYLGTWASGTFKSTDDGNTWTLLTNGLPVDLALNSIAIDPNDPSVVYVCGGGQKGVYKSTDAGASWNQIGTGLPASFISCRSLAIDPLDPNTVYLGTNVGLYKTTSGGGSWGLTGFTQYAYWVAVDPQNPSTVYVTRNDGTPTGGVHKSTDGGQTFVEVLPLSAQPKKVIVDSVTPTTLYLTTAGAGVYKSINGGATWNAINNGLTDLQTRPFLIDPADPSHLFVGTFGGGGIFESIDGGQNWALAPNGGMSGTTIGCLAIGSSGGGAAAVRGWPGRAGAGKRYTLFAGTSAPGGLVQITLTRETHGSLTLTSPNGGESWAIGSHETIAWTATGFGGAVDIELFKRNQKIGTIAREVPTAPGTYSWQVGQLLHKKTAGPGQAYRIRITNAHGPERDESDGGFNITR